MTGTPDPEIACSLDAGSLAERVEAWRDLVATFVESVRVDEGNAAEAGPRSVRLVLRPSDEALVAAASLGQREKECCAFFEVAVELEPDRRTLVLSVPPGAEEALETFVAVLAPEEDAGLRS